MNSIFDFIVMDSVAFIVIFSSFVIAQILLIVSMTYGGVTVLAGDVSKHTFRCSLTDKPQYRFLTVNDALVDLSPYSSLVVHGNSMSKYNVFNGQRVYVEEFKNEEQRLGIKTHPIVVFRIVHTNFLLSQYKLRKFVTYIDDIESVDWKVVFDENSENIKVSKKEFIEGITISKAKITDKSGKFVLSETFDEKIGRNRYSLHHARNVFGKVRYAV